MGRKPKIDYQTKTKAVNMYLNNEKSAIEISNILGVSEKSLRDWIRKYNISGAEGLKTISKNICYSPEIKILAVTDYLSGKVSQCDICSKYNISSCSVLQKWIMKYNNSHKQWKSHNSEENKIMTNGRKTTYEERVEIVAFCIKNNDNYKLTSDEYKVSYQQVYTWVKKYKENGYDALIDNRGKSKIAEQMSDSEKLIVQIRLLEAKNKRLEMENEFLKKLEEIERRG